jgi:Lysylphosphatidylglycerol synthase TM region
LVLLLVLRDPRRRAQRRILDAIAFLKSEQRDRIAGVLETFSQGLECTRDVGSLLLLLAYTLLEWAMIVAGTFALFRGFQATRSLGVPDMLVLMACMTLGSLVQLPAVGGGVQAALIVALTELYGLRLASAASIALMLWMVSTLAIVPFGVACAFHEGLNWSKLKLLSAKQILDSEA